MGCDVKTATWPWCKTCCNREGVPCEDRGAVYHRTPINDEDIARGYTEIERCSCRAPRPMPDAVSQPSHYQSDDGVECIDAIRAALGIDGFVAHCRGTAIKYAWRSGKKAAHAEDLRKACVYLEWAAKAIEDN